MAAASTSDPISEAFRIAFDPIADKHRQDIAVGMIINGTVGSRGDQIVNRLKKLKVTHEKIEKSHKRLTEKRPYREPGTFVFEPVAAAGV